MRRRRWIIPPPPEPAPTSPTGHDPATTTPATSPDSPDSPANPPPKPALYHCISRVVDRRFAFGPDEKEQLRTYMRLYETFSGNRVLSYCFMSNHIHLLLEITPRPARGLSDQELLARVKCIQSPAQVAQLAKELTETRNAIAQGTLKDGEACIQAIHQRHTRRMHDLSQFMKSLLQRYTQWHNSRHKRTGHLWENRFKSLIVEDGVASRTIAAYIDLNPVRAGLVTDPAHYRWSSYGEAIGGGAHGNGKKARAGLVRAIRAHRGTPADAASWPNDVAQEYRNLLLLGARETNEPPLAPSGNPIRTQTPKNLNAEALAAARERLRQAEENRLNAPPYGNMLRSQIRHFTDGAVLGSRAFVDALFAAARDRFGPRRKDGARKPKGRAAPAAGILWTLRDLRNRIE